MKRLNGERTVEKIKFGSELFGFRRRSIYIAMLGALAIIACVSIGIFVFSAHKDNIDKSQENMDEGMESLSENYTLESPTGEAVSGGDGEIVTEQITLESEEESNDGLIVYRDLSSDGLKVINNTSFDIFFLEFQKPSLTKYFDKSSKKPIVLILHTYTSDRYLDSGSRYGVCAVGQVFADELNAMGIGAIYSSAVHDADMNDPLSNSKETIEFYLKMYPSIKYVFDIGIMQEYEGDKVIATDGSFMGERAAQIRLLVAGNNMTTGRDNLTLAAEISKNLNRENMNLAREIVYDDSIRNSIMTPYYIEAFIGSSGNTEEEGILSARVFANAFGEYLV